MKKKRSLIRLFLIILSALSVYSCVHDELTEQPIENLTTAQYASKSLWKEDQIYITKVQQVFLKHANLDFVSRKYGELHWDYAMSFGQFGEKYLLVPVVKDNKAVLLMEAVRKGNKVYFYEKDDAGLLDFFNHVMYSVITRHSEVLNANTAESKYVCSTRTIIVGCPPGVPDCEPISQSQMVCSWEDDSGGIPPKSFDPLGDPNFNGGGGGGIGYNYPDPPEQTPCDKTKNMLDKPNVQQGIDDIKAQAKQTLNNPETGEKGFKELKSGNLVPADVNTAHQVEFNDVTDSYGGYHNHTAGGTHMFSPYDIVDALFGFAAAQSVQDGVGNGYLGMIAAEPCSTCPPDYIRYVHYVIHYAGTGTELGGYVYTTAQMAQFRNDYIKMVNNLTNSYINGSTYTNSSGDLNQVGLEKLFFDTLQNIGIAGKVNLQRIEANGTVYNITQDNNGLPIETPCPN